MVTGNEKELKYDRIWKKLIEHYKERGCYKRSEDFPH